MPAHIVTLLVLGLFTGAAAFTDHRTGHIPNRLVAAGALAAIALEVASALRVASIAGQRIHLAIGSAAVTAVLGAVLCTVVPVVLFRAGAMGGGDVKLLGAVGIAAGPMLGLEIQLTAFVLGVLYAGSRVAYRGELVRLLGSSLALATNPMRSRENRKPVPAELLTSLRFAPAVFAATLVTAIGSWGWS
jgi:prepilin peptidase CpaA